MNWFDYLLGKRRRKQAEAISSLENFVQLVYLGEELSDEEARKNLLDGTIEITDAGSHSSNGLLITNDGYFLTAQHCVDGHRSRSHIVLSDGKEYQFERVCIESKKYDIALAKAKVQEMNKKLRYKLYANHEVKEYTPITLLTRWNGKSIIKSGFISSAKVDVSTAALTQSSINFKDHFTVKLTGAKKGDSGGVIASYNGRIIGLQSWVAIKPKMYELEDFNGCTKIFHALELVCKYVAHVKKQ